MPSGSADPIEPTRLLRRRSLLAAAAFTSLTACGPKRGADQLAADLAAALARGDQQAFVACFGGSAAPTAERLWANWAGLAAVEPRWEGSALRVSWRAPGERHAAEETLGVALDGGRIGALSPTGPAPLWLPERLAVRSAPGAALLAAAAIPDADALVWLQAAAEASGLVAAAGLGPAARSWDGTLVVGLPATPEAFAATSGLPSGQAAATQAATVMATASSAPRVTVSRAGSAALDEAGRRALLVHEGVHVATRSAVSAAPLWLVEGVAESVTAGVDPATRARNAALLDVAPRPRELPTRSELSGAAADIAYAWAAVAVDAAIARWGRPAVMGWLADWAAPDRPAEAAFATTFLASLPG